jgi:hypothetical protein
MTNAPQDVECQARDRPENEIEITPAMIEAGVEALELWYSEPGEPENFKQRAVEDILEAVMQAGNYISRFSQTNSSSG